MKVKHWGCDCYMTRDEEEDLDGYYRCPDCNTEILIETGTNGD